MKMRESFAVNIILETDPETDTDGFVAPCLTQLLSLFESGNFELEYFAGPNSYPGDRPVLLMRKNENN